MEFLKAYTTRIIYDRFENKQMAKPNFDLLFPDERERGETTLRQCQLVMLRMLKIFDYLCNKHDIKYFLTGGTLLGAIRHQGFIPWDDDLDIGMTRDNYEKFILSAVPELPYDIFFQNCKTEPYYPNCGYVEARLRDKYSSYPKSRKHAKKYHDGLLVDIFVYDRAFLPNNLLIILQNKALQLLRNDEKRAKVLKMISSLRFLPFVYASSYIHNLGMMKMGTYVLPAEISTVVKTKFEDMEAFIPSGWEANLIRQYNDYNKLPPVEKRTSTHNVALPDPFTPCEHKEVLYWDKK
jgi:lipopolysaccharide cholinephosphotransferase